MTGHLSKSVTIGACLVFIVMSRRADFYKRYEEKNKKRVTRRKDQKTIKKDKTKRLESMVAPYTLVLTPNGSKKA
jgi:hypothetical protein